MEIILIIAIILLVYYRKTIIYLVRSNKYKYLAAGVYFRHLQNKNVLSGTFVGYIIRDSKNIFDENAIAIFNEDHTMLGYVSTKDTGLFLPLFEYEKRIFIKGFIYLQKNIVLYTACPEIEVDSEISSDVLPIDISDKLLRGEVVNLDREITKYDIPDGAFIGELSKEQDIIEVYHKRRFIGTVRKNKVKFIIPFLNNSDCYPCILITQKGKDAYEFYIDYVICSNPTKINQLVEKYDKNPILFNEIPDIKDSKSLN